MATWETACETVAALPSTAPDTDGRDNPARRVTGTVRVRRNPYLRTPNEEALRRDRGEPIAIRVDRGLHEALIRQDPGTFSVMPHW